jgi:O-antigen/teichoic acid export membrane protein
LFYLIGNIIALILIFLLTKLTYGSLLYLGIVMSSAPTLVLLVSSIWFYAGSYRKYRPAYKFVDFGKAKDLFKLGVKYFIIQIAVVLLYQTNNIVISHLFGPAEVTPYNVAFKYFSVLIMFFSIIITPFWSAFTEAWVKNEIQWIKNIIQKLLRIWGLLFIAGIGMVVFSPWIYNLWIGKSISIPSSVSVLVAIWIIINAWNSIFGHFLNGVGKIKLQLYLGIGAAIANVPLAIILGKSFGIEGVLIANIMVLLVGVYIFPMQYKKIINNRASGIWNR